jgi:hypothetical protein
MEQIKEANRILRRLEDAHSKFLVVHYACESFYGKPAYTPRVTSIAVLNKENNESRMFSIHLSAQLSKMNLDYLSPEDLDKVERSMLCEFASFVDLHQNYIWVHWNMRSASYGFQAISNRYRILGGEELKIPDANKVDLSEVFDMRYSHNFEENEPDGKLINIARRNGINLRDAMPGEKEANAFESRDFRGLHMSTMRKVEVIDRLLTANLRGNLKHAASLKLVYDLTIPGIYGMFRDSWLLLLVWSLFVWALGAGFEPVIQRLLGTDS